jgi:hypothetical protein
MIRIYFFCPFGNIFGVFTLWKVRWEGRVVLTGDTRNVYRILICRIDEKRNLIALEINGSL